MAKIGPLTGVACPVCGEDLPPIPVAVSTAGAPDGSVGMAIDIRPDFSAEWWELFRESHPVCATDE